ncbi:MAG: ABC transporter ATP-binding protein [Chloroflexi bacterium]|nr:ABC transporter ATP-binding protein [Chloroflexota bacterium]
MILQIQDISKWFEGTQILRGVSFSLREGEILSLLGPSGSGKTTLLRVIAGLEVPDAGQVLFDGRDLVTVPPHRRGFGLMFQEYALFPHKNVSENVAFGLRMQRLAAAETARRVAEMLDLVGMTGFEQRDVNRLSGGERQRVALARSLAPRPRLLMLDEPLGALDRALRERLLVELRDILRRVGQTAIYVTHDQQEAFALADRVLIMHEGQIVQAGTPEAVYRRPANEFVARFLGLTNLLPGRVVESGPPSVVQTGAGRMTTEGQEKWPANEPVLVLLAQTATPCSAPQMDHNTIQGVVRECTFRGKDYQVAVQVAGGETLHFDLHDEATKSVITGQDITLQVPPVTVISTLLE